MEPLIWWNTLSSGGWWCCWVFTQKLVGNNMTTRGSPIHEFFFSWVHPAATSLMVLKTLGWIAAGRFFSGQRWGTGGVICNCQVYPVPMGPVYPGCKPKKNSQLEIHTDRAMNFCPVVLSTGFFFSFLIFGDSKLSYIFWGGWLNHQRDCHSFGDFILKGEPVKAKIDNSDWALQNDLVPISYYNNHPKLQISSVFGGWDKVGEIFGGVQERWFHELQIRDGILAGHAST